MIRLSPRSPAWLSAAFPGRLLAALCTVVLLFWFAGGGVLLAAQVDPTATKIVTGTVMDSGHPMPGVQVVLQQVGTQATRSYVTDDEGHYRFTNLSSHMNYKIWARYKGHDYQRRRISKFDANPTPVKDLTLNKRRR